MFFDYAALVLIVWLCKNAAMDVSHAVKGTPNPRYELKQQKLRAAGRPVTGPPRYGTKEYFADLWGDALAAKTEARRIEAAKRKAKEQPIDQLVEATKEPPAAQTPPKGEPTAARGITEPPPAKPSTPASPPPPGSAPTAPTSPAPAGVRGAGQSKPAAQPAPTPAAPTPPATSAPTGNPRIPPGFTREQWAAETRPAGRVGSPEPVKPVDWKAEAAGAVRRRNDPENTTWQDTYQTTVDLYGHGPVCEYCNQAIALDKNRNAFVCWCNKPQPAATPDVPAPAPTQASNQPNNVIPLFRTPNKEKIMPTVNGEVTGLDPAISYAKALAHFAGEHGQAGNEGYIGFLTNSKVSGDGLQSAHDMQEAFANAQAVANRHAEKLAEQKTVQEAYNLNPDAGDKAFQQNGQ